MNNPLDNSLINLTALTHREHTKRHHDIRLL